MLNFALGVGEGVGVRARGPISEENQRKHILRWFWLPVG